MCEKCRLFCFGSHVQDSKWIGGGGKQLLALCSTVVVINRSVELSFSFSLSPRMTIVGALVHLVGWIFIRTQCQNAYFEMVLDISKYIVLGLSLE